MLDFLRRWMRKAGRLISKSLTYPGITEFWIWARVYVPSEQAQSLGLDGGRVRVSGKQISSVSYDSGTRILEVRYKDSALRCYSDVSERAYEALVSSDMPDEALAREVFGAGRE